MTVFFIFQNLDQTPSQCVGRALNMYEAKKYFSWDSSSSLWILD